MPTCGHGQEAFTRRAAVAASRTLSARWTEAVAVGRHGEAVDRILDEARPWDAHAVVIGWRGHARFAHSSVISTEYGRLSDWTARIQRRQSEGRLRPQNAPGSTRVACEDHRERGGRDESQGRHDRGCAHLPA